MVTIEKNDETSWQDLSGKNCYVCRATIFRDPETSRYTALAKRLPGCISEGDTIEEAIANIREAFAGVVSSYISHHEIIPWEDVVIEDSDVTVEKSVAVVVEVDA
jgi:predicted RNase H-like HicB family nuclease